MFDFSFGELVVLAVIALLVVGPDKMPEMARTAGRWYGVLRRTLTGVRAEVEQQLLLDDLRREADQLRNLANEDLLVPPSAPEPPGETPPPPGNSAVPAVENEAVAPPSPPTPPVEERLH
ncbi:MAG: Sec-independent protein translocase protein TatB [Acidithiobacillus sp.]